MKSTASEETAGASPAPAATVSTAPAPAGERTDARDSAGTGRDDPWKIRGVSERVAWLRGRANLHAKIAAAWRGVRVSRSIDDAATAAALTDLADRIERDERRREPARYHLAKGDAP